MAEATCAFRLASADTAPSTGMISETGSNPINAWCLARSALWRDKIIFSSSGREVSLTSKLSGLACLEHVDRCEGARRVNVKLERRAHPRQIKS